MINHSSGRMNIAKILCKRDDFKRFISHELEMDVIKPEDLSDEECFNMIVEYSYAASPEELDSLAKVTCEFLRMVRQYEGYKKRA